MNFKTFALGILFTILSGTIFTISSRMLELIIPSLVFAGVICGVYVSVKRKRPMSSCVYDSFITSMPASILLGFIEAPILWFYHGIRFEGIDFWIFLLLIITGAVLLAGVAGGPLGGLVTGMYYRYLKQDRGEAELYETYIEEKTSDKKKKTSDLADW